MNTRKFVFKILIPIILLTLPFVVPLFSSNIDIPTLSSIFSLVFAILVGFFIATATSNYLNFQNYLAEEAGHLINIYNLGKLVQPKAAKKLQQTIDKYVIATLDYPLMEYADKTTKEFETIIEVIDTIEPQDTLKRRIAALNYLHETKANLIKTIQSILFTAPRIVFAIHWFILITLTIIITLLLYGLRTDEIISGIVTGFMSLSLYLILMLLYEVDNNQFLENRLAFEDAQKVFRAIGTLPYYPEIVLKNHRANAPKEVYRIGMYKNFPASLKKEIKIVRTNF